MVIVPAKFTVIVRWISFPEEFFFNLDRFSFLFNSFDNDKMQHDVFVESDAPNRPTLQGPSASSAVGRKTVRQRRHPEGSDQEAA